MFKTLISAQDLYSMLQSANALTATGKPIMVFYCTYDLAKQKI